MGKSSEIRLTRPNISQPEIEAVTQVLLSGMLVSGPVVERFEKMLADYLGLPYAVCVSSGTAALHLSLLSADIKPGDEVIMPSYTFSSTANAFVLRGAKIVFIDIRPDTMNIDEKLIEAAITSKTRAVVPVHYAGVGCEMDTIVDIADRYGLHVIEDAAQGMMSKYKGAPLGSIGHMGAFSFHETKNYTSGGEGGLLIVNDNSFVERAEIIREKGTNRNKFHRGIIDKYSWIDIGSSYLPNEISAAFLFGQLEKANEINENRRASWLYYFDNLKFLRDKNYVELPTIPDTCTHNAHMFYIKVKNIEERTALIKYLGRNDIQAVSHYIPLHSTEGGAKYSRFYGEDRFTTKESERLIRLPLFYGLNKKEIGRVVKAIGAFFAQKS